MVIASTPSVSTIRTTTTEALVRVAGELDATTVAPLRRALQEHRDLGRRYLRLDLSGVTLVDAVVLSEFVRVHRELLAERGTLVITGVRAAVARVIQVTGLHEVLFIGGVRADFDVRPGHLDLTAELDPAADADIYLDGLHRAS
jgi:anti-sigma B factor antagonist